MPSLSPAESLPPAHLRALGTWHATEYPDFYASLPVSPHDTDALSSVLAKEDPFTEPVRAIRPAPLVDVPDAQKPSSSVHASEAVPRVLSSNHESPTSDEGGPISPPERLSVNEQYSRLARLALTGEMNSKSLERKAAYAHLRGILGRLALYSEPPVDIETELIAIAGYEHKRAQDEYQKQSETRTLSTPEPLETLEFPQLPRRPYVDSWEWPVFAVPRSNNVHLHINNAQDSIPFSVHTYKNNHDGYRAPIYLRKNGKLTRVAKAV